MKKFILIPTLLFLFINILFALRFYTLKIQEYKEQEQQFNLSAKIFHRELQYGLQKNTDITYFIASFFDASTSVSRDQFRIFTQAILKTHPEIQALKWLPYVKHQDRLEYERLAQQEEYSDFQFLDYGKNNPQLFLKASDQTHYTPVYYAESLSEHETRLGVNLFSDSDFHKAMLFAKQTNALSYSPPITLVQEKPEQKVILIFMPVFKSNIQVVPLQQKQLKGFVLVVLQLDRFFESMKTAFIVNEMLDFSLMDISDIPHQLIIGSEKPEASISHKNILQTEYQWNIVGRKWKYVVRTDLSQHPALIQNIHTLLKETLFLGLCIGLLFAIGCYFLIKSNFNQSQNEEKIKNFIEHSIDAFFLHDSAGQLLEVNQQACLNLGYTQDELLSLYVQILK